MRRNTFAVTAGFCYKMMQRIALCEYNHSVKDYVEYLAKHRPDLEILTIDSTSLEPNKNAVQCTVLLTNPILLKTLAPKMPNLQWVHSTFAGVDALFNADSQLKEQPSWKLTRTGGFFGQLMAEYVLGNVISWERKFTHYAKVQEARRWDSTPFFYRTLSDLTIGFLGIGDIGSQVARVCKSFGMTTWGYVRSEKNIGKCRFIDEYRMGNQLTDVLQNCDYICSVLPSTKETDGILDGKMLENCTSKGSVLINVGRGNVVSNEGIENALRNNWIKGAILDVFPEEPLSVDSPLWHMENVVITPHNSAMTLPTKAAKLFLENLQRFEVGEELLYCVDWKNQY